MSLETVRIVVKNFLSNEAPGVLVLKGAWGVGKTYAWDELLLSSRDTLQIRQYAYVSLFGLTSVSELRSALVAKAIPTKFIGKKIDWETVNREWSSMAKATMKRLSQWGPKIQKAIPYIKDVSISFDSIAGYLLGETIICLDDWERAKIDPSELLGLISELKVERGCKVVLIFNDGKLDEDRQRLYKEYREKLVDVELVFAPTARESIAIAIKPDVRYGDHLRDAVLRLNLSNVRLIRKMQMHCDVLHPAIKNAHAAIQKQVVYTAALFTWLHFGEPSDRKPAIEFVRGWNRLGSLLRERREGADPRQQVWASVLGAYDYSSTDELDLAVDQVIEQGYIEGTALQNEILAKEGMLAATERESVFNKAWELFHGSFEDNEEQVIKALENGLRASVQYVSPMNLSSTVEVLRQLNRGALADELIEFYIDQRKADSSLFDLRRSAFGSRVSDETVRTRFAQEAGTTASLPSLHDAVLAAASKQGWTQEEDQVMKGASADEIYHSILAPGGMKFLQACEWMSTVQGWEDFRRKLHEALTRIASASPLNAARVARFGIVPPAEAATHGE